MKGRKRHLVVDVLGLVLGCYVSAANTADIKAAPAVLLWVLDLYERIAKVLADKGYRGELASLIQQAFGERQVKLELVNDLRRAKVFKWNPSDGLWSALGPG